MSITIRDDIWLAAAAGLLPGHSTRVIIGANPSVDMAAPEDLWDAGGTYAFATDLAVLNVVSTSANDAGAGTGAQTVFVEGLDDQYNPVSETITLNGLTPVPTANKYFRVNSAKVVTAGSGGSAAGTITFTHQGTGTPVLAQINIGNNITLSSIYTVPAGKTAFVAYTEASIGKAKEGDAVLNVRPLNEVFRKLKSVRIFEKKSFTISPVPSVVSQKSDMKVTFSVDTNNSDCDTDIRLLLVDNEVVGL